MIASVAFQPRPALCDRELMVFNCRVLECRLVIMGRCRTWPPCSIASNITRHNSSLLLMAFFLVFFVVVVFLLFLLLLLLALLLLLLLIGLGVFFRSGTDSLVVPWKLLRSIVDDVSFCIQFVYVVNQLYLDASDDHSHGRSRKAF